MTPLIVAACFAMMAASVGANILLKQGAGEIAGAADIWGWLGPKIIAGGACFAVAFGLYVWVLRHVPLNVAQSLFTFQFVGVILAAALFLGEPISPLRWFGIGVITLGILIVAWTNAAA
jgi:drug/metabolite transporter (DMT)-like permease